MERKLMKAMVLEKPCSAEEMKIKNVPIPEVKEGWVLVKVKAFGINRAEIFTRQGDSPSLKLPRIIGIECVGVVENPSNSSFKKGDKVFSMMNGMGREFDGSYAEYILIPKNQVYTLKLSEKSWEMLAAYPELYYTAYGSLFRSLKLKQGETLLIRGGTSSVALAAIQLAKAINVKVAVTTRNTVKEEFLKEKGADEIIIEDEKFDENLRKIFPEGVDKVLELIGTPTLKSSLKSVKQGGVVCMTGCLGGWVINEFEPLDDIMSESYLTSFNSTYVNKNVVMKCLILLKNIQLSLKFQKFSRWMKFQKHINFWKETKQMEKLL